MDQPTVELTDKYFTVETDQDGYFNIYKGLHPYKIIEEDGDYIVYPTEWDTDGNLTNKAFPIIRTDDGDVFFIKGDRNDPYNSPNIQEITTEGMSLEKKVLEAFNAYAYSQYTLGQNPIYVFVANEFGVGTDDEETNFVLRDHLGNIVEEDTGGEDEGGEEEEGDD